MPATGCSVRIVCLTMLVCCSYSLAAVGAATEEAETLHERIDQALSDASLGQLSPVADDATFVRRAYIDLIGVIPSVAEARAFLADTDPNRRAKLIDELLADRRAARHWANVFDVFIMERRRDTQIKSAEWREYLLRSFRSDKPWDVLAREILGADGSEEKIRAAAKFYLDRNGDVDLITRDVGRVFFGMDLQCCQCHDHPLIDTFYQSDYYGIYAFVNRGFVFTDSDKQTIYAEKAEGDVEFTSVFTEEKGSTRPQLPGAAQISEPPLLSGDEYIVKPASKVRPIPRYSRRERLAELATDGSNAAFNRNIVNRLWACLMGRGLTHPVDLNHIDNPPAHPSLAEMLADEFVLMNYDIKAFVRELALTRAYQWASQSHSVSSISRTLITAQTDGYRKTLDDSRQDRAGLQAELSAAEKRLNGFERVLAASAADLAVVNKRISDARKKADAEQKKADEATQKLTKKKLVAVAVRTAAESAQQAAGLLADDQALQEAAEKFVARSQSLGKEVAAIEGVMQTLSANARAAELAWEAAREAGAPTIRTIESAASDRRAAVHAAGEAREAVRLIDVAIATAEKRLEIVEAATALQELQSQLSTLRESFESVSVARTKCSDACQVQSASLVSLQSDLAAAAEKSRQLAGDLQDARQQVQQAEVRCKAIVEAAEKAAIAVAKLAEDDPLRELATAIESRRQGLELELAEAQGSLNELIGAARQSDMRERRAEQQLAAMEHKLADDREELARLATETDGLRAQLEQTQSAWRTAQEAWVDCSGEHFFAGRIRAMSPEQLAWSMMEATGFLGRQRQSATAAADETLPPSPTLAQDRVEFLEDHVWKKVRGHIQAFVRLFGHSAGQPQSDFFATVDQALFFANSSTVQAWLKPNNGNLTDRLIRQPDPRKVAEELYLSVLTRYPSDEERQEVADYLADRVDDRAAAIRQMSWGLLTSAEFRFIH